MPFDQMTSGGGVPADVSPLARADKALHGRLAVFTGGLSPIATAQAWLDWAGHLALSPGKQVELWQQAGRAALGLAAPGPDDAPAHHVGGFAGEGWDTWPYAAFRHAQRATEAWWRAATTGVRGVSDHHARLVAASVGRVLQAASPANFLLTNPELQRITAERGGRNLLDGARNFARDLAGARSPASDAFAVGKTLALTPGKVVFRNRLIELIQYTPTTPMVHPEPVLIVPAWIMKYYILDLRPENSLLRYLVAQGHTVFTISWCNPTAADRDLDMDDYRRLGILAALDAIGAILPGVRTHAAGYCLGGTMLAITAAAMGRDGDDRLASVTLLAAQTDFTEPGALQLYIDDAELAWLDSMMDREGVLDGRRMAAAFQMMRAEALIWSPFVHRYLLGEADHPNDLMAWNADQTRMPSRMHAHYLHSLFLRNELAEGHFLVDGRPVALRDLRVPVFALGTMQDHVAPWRSVYKIALLSGADVTFVLTSGGHNAGVVSEPGHTGRRFHLRTMPHATAYIDPDAYLQQAGTYEGSWWTAWHAWLAERSGMPVASPAPAPALCDAPGTYVLAA